MRKQLTLKLIETNDTPNAGDLVSVNGVLSIFHIALRYTSGIKVVKPYGVSDERDNIKSLDYTITVGDLCIYNNKLVEIVEYYNERFTIEYDESGLTEDIHINDVYLKVILTPEQFNYQEIVDLGLKDGDEIQIDDYGTLGTSVTTGRPLSISKPSPAMYTEEEVFNLFIKFRSTWYEFLVSKIDSLEGGKSIESVFEEWFDKNKKK